MNTIEQLVHDRKLERVWHDIFILDCPLEQLPKTIRKQVAHIESFTAIDGKEIVFIRIDNTNDKEK